MSRWANWFEATNKVWKAEDELYCNYFAATTPSNINLHFSQDYNHPSLST